MSPQFSGRAAASMAALVAAGFAVGATGALAAAPPSAVKHHKRFQARGYARPHARKVRSGSAPADGVQTATPIKHVVVIYQENVSFDHYFATYPFATNRRSEPRFAARPGTPTVNGLNTPLLEAQNPNSFQPFRLDRSQAATCDQDHEYHDEQVAFDRGLMDLFPETVGSSGGSCADYGYGKNLVMGYYDGNTTTALWNYAQHYAMSDNSFGTTFGPSTPGAINLVSGQTHGVVATSGNVTGDLSADGKTIENDPQPLGDDCSNRDAVRLGGRNVGDLLNQAGVTWGWFQGGFTPTSTTNGTAVCGASHTGADGKPKGDYIPHHEPFQYYLSTANLHHRPPSSTAMIGSTDQANHQYDLSAFWTAVNAGKMPSVSFLKAAGYQDGHAGYSSPLNEQQFVTDTINRLQTRREWKSTAVVIAYDDSDGWYDHQMSPIVNQSQDPGNGPMTGTGDALTAAGQCGTKAPAGGYQGRCGYGPRLPLLVISPWAKSNFVDHSTTDQSSILQAIEQNWGLPSIGDASFDQRAGSLVDMFNFSDGGGNTPPLGLDPSTGEPASGASASCRRGRSCAARHRRRRR